MPAWARRGSWRAAGTGQQGLGRGQAAGWHSPPHQTYMTSRAPQLGESGCRGDGGTRGPAHSQRQGPGEGLVGPWAPAEAPQPRRLPTPLAARTASTAAAGRHAALRHATDPGRDWEWAQCHPALLCRGHSAWALLAAQKHANTQKKILSPLLQCGHSCFPRRCWSHGCFQKVTSPPWGTCPLGQQAPGPPGTARTPHLRLCTPKQHMNMVPTGQAKPCRRLELARHCPAPARPLPAGPGEPQPAPRCPGYPGWGGWHIPAPKPGPHSSPTNEALGSWPPGNH